LCPKDRSNIDDLPLFMCSEKDEGGGGEEGAYDVNTLFDDVVQDILGDAVDNRGLLLKCSRIGHALPYPEKAQ
jgi:hypothetical protein